MSSQPVLSSPEFLALLKSRRRVSLLLSAAMMGAYFAFVLVLALRKTLFADSTIAGLPTGIFFGLSLIVLAWVLTGIYVYWANAHYDSQVATLKARVASQAKGN